MSLIHLAKSPTGSTTFRIYARAIHGLSFRIATSADMDDVYRFRFRIYSEEAYISPEDHPDKKFSDEYDSRSVSVTAVKNHEILGAARITHYSDLGLPTLDYFNISLPDDVDPKSVVEMGRFIVHPRHRGKSRIISIGLSLLLKSHVRNDSTLEWLVAFMSDDVRRSFHAFVPFRILDELPLETKHVSARELLPGYWAKGRIHPVIARSSELL